MLICSVRNICDPKSVKAFEYVHINQMYTYVLETESTMTSDVIAINKERGMVEYCEIMLKAFTN